MRGSTSRERLERKDLIDPFLLTTRFPAGSLLINLTTLSRRRRFMPDTVTIKTIITIPVVVENKRITQLLQPTLRFGYEIQSGYKSTCAHAAYYNSI
jgi:hypothetical protein